MILRRLTGLALTLALLCGTAAPASAQVTSCPGLIRPAVAFAYEAIAVSTTAVGFTLATMTGTQTLVPAYAVVSVETNTIRWREDGTAPTAGEGHSEVAAAKFVVCGPNMGRFKAIRASADATLRVTYYRVQ